MTKFEEGQSFAETNLPGTCQSLDEEGLEFLRASDDIVVKLMGVIV